MKWTVKVPWTDSKFHDNLRQGMVGGAHLHSLMLLSSRGIRLQGETLHTL